MNDNSRISVIMLGFSEAEHRLVIDAEVDHGEYFAHACDTVGTLMEVISWSTVSCEVFLRFLAQMKKSLLLCMTSIVRQHRIQAMMNLRYFLETTSHAAYSLAYIEISTYVKDGQIDDPKAISKKVYKWLEVEHPDVSSELKRMKGDINSEVARASLLNSVYTFALEGDPVTVIRNELFDFDDAAKVNADLLHCAHARLLALELLETVRLKHGGYIPSCRAGSVPALRETNRQLRAALEG